MGGDGNSLKGKNHFFRRNSDVCLCVHTCIRAYVHIDILVLKRGRKERGWEFLRELSRDFPTFSNLKEKALYKWQYFSVFSTSVVLNENRCCHGEKGYRLKRLEMYGVMLYNAYFISCFVETVYS